MTSKFKISKVQEVDSIHLRLFGDFTDISICELINVLKDDCTAAHNVFIHTGELGRISVSGFGRDVFRRNLTNFQDNEVQIHFTGQNGDDIIPMTTSLRA
ncbi:MAG: hypothetical protein ACOZF0_17020 [Thermodesulfobacteriota bacterium]